MVRLTVGTESLWVEELGGREPALVFIHGNSLSAESWKRQMDAQELSGWRRITWDLPGHGRSDRSERPEHRYSLPGYAETTRELVKALGLRRVVLVGHSLGGHIALQAAPDIPELAGLFLFGMAPLTGVEDAPRVFKAEGVQDFLSAGELSRDQAERMASLLFQDPDSVPAHAVEALRAADPGARPALGESFAAGRLRDELAIARDLDCPLALVYAEEDEVLQRSYVEALDLPLWRGGVQRLEGEGHSPHWEGPERFNQLLRQFVESIS